MMLHFLIFIATVGVLIFPWTLRNYIHFHRFIPVNIGLGRVVWGYSAIADGNDKEKYFDYVSSKYSTEVDAERELELKTIKSISQYPIAFFINSSKKLLIYWLGGHTYNWGFNKNIFEYFTQKEYYRLFGKLSILFIHNLLLLFGLCGFLIVRFKNKLNLVIISLILYYSLVHMFTSPVSRHHLPVLPYIFIYVALLIGGKYGSEHNYSNI